MASATFLNRRGGRSLIDRRSIEISRRSAFLQSDPVEYNEPGRLSLDRMAAGEGSTGGRRIDTLNRPQDVEAHAVEADGKARDGVSIGTGGRTAAATGVVAAAAG